MPNLRAYDPLVLVTSFSSACLARIAFAWASRGSASVYAKQSTHLSQIHAIVSNPARPIQRINAGGIAPDVEGNAAVGHVDTVAGHGVRVGAVSDIAHRNILIASAGKTHDGIAFAVVVIADEAHAAAPFTDLTHGRFLQGGNASTNEIEPSDVLIQRMSLGGCDICVG